MMNVDNLWTVNDTGLFCVENSRFCRNATSSINESINHHEKGNAVQGHEVIIDSNTAKITRYGLKVGAAVAAAYTGNPVAAVAFGTGT